MRNRPSGYILEFIGPPLRVLGFLVGKLYLLLFGWHGRRWARNQQRKLEEEVRDKLGFLFSRYDAQLLPAKEIRRTADISWPTVRVAANCVVLGVGRCLNEVNASVAPVHAPQDRHELLLVLTLLDPKSNIRRNWTLYSPASVGRLLEPRMDLLRKAFSEEGYPEFRKQLAEVEDYDRIVNRQFEAELNWKLYGR